jgi:hypothetical protein
VSGATTRLKSIGSAVRPDAEGLLCRDGLCAAPAPVSIDGILQSSYNILTVLAISTGTSFLDFSKRPRPIVNW